MIEEPALPIDAKLTDEPIQVVDTGFTYRGYRLFLEGDDASVVAAIAREAEREMPCLSRKPRGDATEPSDPKATVEPILPSGFQQTFGQAAGPPMQGDVGSRYVPGMLGSAHDVTNDLVDQMNEAVKGPTPNNSNDGEVESLYRLEHQLSFGGRMEILRCALLDLGRTVRREFTAKQCVLLAAVGLSLAVLLWLLGIGR